MKAKKIIVTAVMVTMSMPIFSETEVVDDIEWTYTINYDKASVGGGSSSNTAIATSTSGAITIPSTLGGKPVTSIGNDAFYNCSGLTNVTIPDSVTTIEDGAFALCSNLTSVTIPSNVTTIGHNTFSSCVSVTNVTIQNGEVWIGYYAFSNCTSLKSVTMPEGLWCISKGMFFECTGITNINIPDGVTQIEEEAFQNCSSLTNVRIPDSLTFIHKETFSGCGKLTKISVSSDHPEYKTQNGMLLSKDGKTLVQGVNGNVVIPEGVTEIGECAFYGRDGLTSVTLPASAAEIGSRVFSGCTNLMLFTVAGGNATFRFKDGVLYNVPQKRVMVALFNAVSSMVFEEGTEIIGDGAFVGTSTQASLRIPSSVCNIGSGNVLPSDAFKTPSGIVVCDGWVLGIDRDVLLEYIGYDDRDWHCVPSGELNLAGVRGIADKAFDFGWSHTEISLKRPFLSGRFFTNVCVRIPSTCKYIGYSAFGSESGLCGAHIILEEGVERIDAYAFSGDAFRGSDFVFGEGMRCQIITPIPKSVTYIGDYAFAGCSGFTNVTISSNLKSIGSGAFQESENLISATLPYSLKGIINVEGVFGGYFGLPEGFSVNYIVPDIAVMDVAVQGDEVLPGEAVNVFYTVENKGDVDAAGWVESVRLVAGDYSKVLVQNTVTNVLRAGEGERHTVPCIIPDEIPSEGTSRIVCRAELIGDFADPELSNNEAASSELPLKRSLALVAQADSIKENENGGVRFTVKRSGCSTTGELSVTVHGDNASAVDIPAMVTIPAGSSGRKCAVDDS